MHTIRQQLKTKTIYDLPLRVTFYARVSSEKDEQLDSLGNQIAYYQELIRKNPAQVICRGRQGCADLPKQQPVSPNLFLPFSALPLIMGVS